MTRNGALRVASCTGDAAGGASGVPGPPGSPQAAPARATAKMTKRAVCKALGPRVPDPGAGCIRLTVSGDCREGQAPMLSLRLRVHVHYGPSPVPGRAPVDRRGWNTTQANSVWTGHRQTTGRTSSQHMMVRGGIAAALTSSRLPSSSRWLSAPARSESTGEGLQGALRSWGQGGAPEFRGDAARRQVPRPGRPPGAPPSGGHPASPWL